MSNDSSTNGHAAPDGKRKGRKNRRSPAPSSNGRDVSGRFVKGNPGGTGNPHAHQVQRFRTLLYSTVKDADVRAVWRKLIAKAKAGEPWAVKEFNDRVWGKATQAHVLLEAAREEAGGSLTHAQADAMLAVLGDGEDDAAD